MPAASASLRRSTASRAREVVIAAVNALKAVWHRGAVDADGKTGDAPAPRPIPQILLRPYQACRLQGSLGAAGNRP